MNHSLWNAFARTAISVAVAAVVAPAMAQNTTSIIAGRVVGADGKAVANASVTVLHVESGSVNRVVSDTDGRYRASGLRVGGPFTVTVSKDGATSTRSDVFTVLAETLDLDLTVGTASLAAVTVSQSALDTIFDSARTGAGTSISNQELNALPSIKRNLYDYARLDPRVSQTDKGNGEISAGGQNSKYNVATIDGVSISDTFGLESNNFPTLKQPIPIDAIQSVQVNVANFDVTQKGYTGANINAVTKSGTNEVKGSTYFVYRDDNMSGKRYNNLTDVYTQAPKFKETTKGFTLGGPIISDKLFYFVAYEELKSTRTSPDFGVVGSSAAGQVGITSSAVASAQSIAKNTYGINIGGLDTPSKQLQVRDTLAKFDWNINDSHRASLRFSRTDQTEPIYPNFSATALSLDSNWYSQVKTIDSVVGQWIADWTNNFSTEAKVSSRKYSSQPLNNADLPQMSLAFSGALPTGAPTGLSTGSRSLYFGTEQSRHFNVLTTDTVDAYLAGTYTYKNHDLKFGGDYSQNQVYNAFLQNTKGNYSFACINSSATFTYTNPLLANGVTCSSATQAQVEAAVLENFQRGRPLTYQVQNPLPGRTLADGVASWTLGNTGAFLQDNIAINNRLKVVVGARLDQISSPDKPLSNSAASAPVVAGNAATNTRQTGGFGLNNSFNMDGKELFQPRLGFNWDLSSAERRSQLRGGAGLFQGAAANVWLSNPYSNTGVATSVIGCGIAGYSACPPTDGLLKVDPNAQITSFTGTIPAANVDFLDPSLKQPSVTKFNLAFEQELPIKGVIASAEIIQTRSNNAIYYKYLNLGPTTRTGLDGRELYYNAAGYDTNCWTATGGTNASGTAGCSGSVTSKALRNAAFNNVTVATNTNQGGGNAMTLALSQPANQGLGWALAYTKTSATEVSPLTSSVANSNWLNRSVFNPNEDVASNSNFLVRERINAGFTWAQALFGNRKTTMGLFYEGRTGKPYSWTYGNDLNGDGVSGNDLMYIPKGVGSGEVVFKGGAAEEAAFWQIVNDNPDLAKAKGGVVSRNSSFSPWTNSFDLRLSQELPGLTAKTRGFLIVDFLNVGNLINRNWGRIDESPFPLTRNFVYFNGVDSQGRYIYSLRSAGVSALQTRQTAGESQYAIQVTARYEF